jgi:hypothetical protein
MSKNVSKCCKNLNGLDTLTAMERRENAEKECRISGGIIGKIGKVKKGGYMGFNN